MTYPDGPTIITRLLLRRIRGGAEWRKLDLVEAEASMLCYEVELAACRQAETSKTP